MLSIVELGKKSRSASNILSSCKTAQKNAALESIARGLISDMDEILKANAKDMEAAKERGTVPTFLDRLYLDEKRIKGISEGVMSVVALTDPVGEVTQMSVRENGLKIGRYRAPLGVIGIIFEARPNVTVDAAALCLKAGNSVILRGGKEAFNSNYALTNSMRKALSAVGIPQDGICLVENTSRESAVEMMQASGIIDVLIPRGGAGLIKTVVSNARVPVIETGTGNCHVYVDDSADLDMAAKIIYNAKTSRPSVCNAAESLLVHERVANKFLPMAKALLDQKNVELRGCEKTRGILGNSVQPATEEDYFAEFLDYILSVKVVSDVDAAIAHINHYSTKHSEAIITESYSNSQKFLESVDSAAVYINASTRFTDGFEFGLGAEIGISTQKLHARGPMGLEKLTSEKFIIYGQGQVR